MDKQFIRFQDLLLLKKDDISKIREGGINQNLKLFIRGNAMSGLPTIIGKNQLPNPLIKIGITIKKIIKKACKVTIEL